MIRGLPLIGLLLLGCGASSEEPDLDAPPPVHTPASVPFDQAAFRCCDGERVQRLVAEYLDLQRALGHDDLPRAQDELLTLRGVALAAADDPGLSDHSRGLARQVAGLLGPAAGGDLPRLREAFLEVSTKVIVLAQANQGGALDVAVAICPRANANWLQAEPQLLNPFQGSLEPSSGAFRR